ncbi:MAG: patatin family protein [Spirochaetae bacterium HGW-Spirochaetae-1]|jgi:predicted patatin/cPLA2 family phospholipase|nr:MAG: patatin family protein [Spirochaetae bacterium HGW-Spirochaetae-1]
MTENENKGLLALVAEGGGMRGIFTAGVLNSFGKCGYDPFDMYIGVSAGACNLASHLAGQFERNYFINTNYSLDRRFMNAGSFFRGGHYMDLDWLWEITIREYRLNLAVLFGKLERKRGPFLITATSAVSGRALYLEPREDSLEHYLKVSSSLPVLYRNMLETEQGPATDGGIADSIPVMEAYRRGATDITVIRTRPRGYVKRGGPSRVLLPVFFRKYPRLADAFRKRADAYMEAVKFMDNPPEGVRIREISPPRMSVGRTCRDIELLNDLYARGIAAGMRHAGGK